MSEPGVEIDFDAFTNIAMVRLSRRLVQIFHREALKPAGLTVQEFRTLINLAAHGDIHLRALSRSASLDPGHISRALPALEAKGLLVRKEDPEDARRTLLSLTDAGQQMALSLWPSALTLTEDLRKEVGAERFDAFQNVLKDLLNYAEDRLATPDEMETVE